MTASIHDFCRAYGRRLHDALNGGPIDAIAELARTLATSLTERRQVFIVGNGGSAGNAIHLANDFLYGMGLPQRVGLRVEALAANPSIMTCLANDISYDEVFAEQLRIKGSAGDVLIVLSGSGNSPNVVRALETANAMNMKTFALLGYSGGKCRALAQVPIHFSVDDMQVAEDLQLVVGHICMQWVRAQLTAPEAATQ